MEREREGGKKSDRESSIIKRYKVSVIPTFQHHNIPTSQDTQMQNVLKPHPEYMKIS